MENSEIERLLSEIGALLAEDDEHPLDGTLLYAQLDRGSVGPSIYKNLADKILYRTPDLDKLGGALLDLWEAQDSELRWAEIEYLIEDGKFTAKFNYPDEMTEEDLYDFDRRELIVQQYFGDKPIVYPPIDEDDDDAPTYEL